MWCSQCGKSYLTLRRCPDCGVQLLDFPLPDGVVNQWPYDESGTPVPPVFLMCCEGQNMGDEILGSLLSAYGFPYIVRYPNEGELGRLILGVSQSGAYFFVPKTMLSEIKSFLEDSLYDEL